MQDIDIRIVHSLAVAEIARLYPDDHRSWEDLDPASVLHSQFAFADYSIDRYSTNG
jgi:hypothetical protein